MIPTMTYFEQALSAPDLHFKRLRQAEPSLLNGRPIVRRTHTAIESEIMLEGHRYLLSLPFRSESIRYIEELERISRDRSRGPMIECRVLYDELTMVDSLGCRHNFDVVLQEIPRGCMLGEAVERYCAEDLRRAVLNMKARMDALGFRHNNLRPSNIVLSEQGIAHPLRYWYAEWEDFSDNDVSQLLEFIDKHDIVTDATKKSLVQQDDYQHESAPKSCCGITRICKGGNYGFVGSDGVQITPFVYSWASDFCEGRAIVAKGCKVGVIDCSGAKVIHSIYEKIDFDIETGWFSAIRGGYRYLISYDGDIICRESVSGASESGNGAEK